MNKTVLITGASSGIGKALAYQMAANGYSLLLSARNKDELARIQGDISQTYQSTVFIFQADLGKEEDCEALIQFIRENAIQIDVLVNNAGIGKLGVFASTSWDTHKNMMRVNMEALTRLTYFCIQGMLERNDGIILNISSIAAYQPGPYMAIYYASKAYVQSLSEALSYECKNTGVQVKSLAPGPVKTDFIRKADLTGARLFSSGLMPVFSSEQIAKRALRLIKSKRKHEIPGLVNKLTVMVQKFLPSFLVNHMVGFVHFKKHQSEK